MHSHTTGLAQEVNAISCDVVRWYSHSLSKEDITMKYMTSVCLSSLLISYIFFAVSIAKAQSKDVVYLKNGSVIKGQILEIVPNSQIKIQTADGNIFVWSFSEIEKVTKESAVPGAASTPSVPKGESTPSTISTPSTSMTRNAPRYFPTNAGSVWFFGDLKFSSKGGDANETDGHRYVSIDLDPTLAYFLIPGVAAGLNVQLRTSWRGDNRNTTWGIGPAIIFVVGGDQPRSTIQGSPYPYLVAAGLIGSQSYKSSSTYYTYTTTSSIIGISLGPGICMMLTESLGLNMRISYNYYSIKPENGSAIKGNDLDMEVGLVGVL
jgi:hypothetical protein